MSREQAVDIRAALAKAGFGRAEVSVRNESYSMGSTVRVRIKKATVPLSRVEAIARQYEKVDRCSATGEILSGGNRFVDVEYEREALEPLGAILQRALEAGRQRFGPLLVTPEDKWSRGVWLMEGNAGSHLQRIDLNHGGESLARLVAARGLLGVVDDVLASEVAT